MHGCDSEPVLIVNAEVDSMGGVVEGGVDIANKTSPRKAAIEKVQVELRREYDNRDKTKRQLEFLEKGGDLLDYMIGNAASISVHSTSFTGQHPDQFVTSEAKGSVAFTASPHGDSVESSGRPGRPSCEPNSADNLMLLDAENGSSEGDRTLFHRSSGQAMPSEHSCQVDGTHKNREHGDCAPLVLPGKAYKRRNRSRPNRDGARSSSSDVNPTHGSHGCSLPSHSAARDVKGLLSDAEKRNTSLNWNSQPTTPIESTIHSKTTSEGGKNDTELDRSNSAALTEDLVKRVPADAESDSIASKNHLDEQLDGHSLSGVPKAPTQMDSNGLEAVKGQEEMASVVIECHPSPAATIVENQFRSSQINGFSGKKGDEVTNDSNNSSALCGVKYLGSESCKPTNPSNGIETYTRIRIVSSNGNAKDQSLVPDATPVTESDKIIKQKDTEGINSSTRVNEASPKQELNQNISALKNEVKNQLMIDRMEVCWPTGAESGRRPPEPLCVSHGPQNETSHDIKHPDSIDIPILDLPKTGSLTRVCNVSLEAQTLSEPDLKSEKRIDEDSVLKEAEIIKAKRRRIAELSIVTAPPEFREKSHWDYVLEEIAWLANDFAQERIWKLASAAQISSRVAFACRLRKQEKSLGMTAKKVSHTLARAVMEFWHCVEIQIQESSKELEQEQQNPKDGTLSVQAYAVRFLRHNKSNIFQNQTEVPLTPEKESDSGIPDISWEDSFTEENLFYEVPHGAMDSYRKLIESHVAQCEKIGGHMQEELETSACDTAAGFGYQHIVYDEDEGETSTYNMSVALEGSKPSRFGQKKQKYLTNDYGSRSYEMGAGLLPMRCVENKDVTEQSTLLGKRPGSSLKLSIPTKRIRTASRRVTSTFSAGASEGNQVPNKTEASSGDTNSFQDVQSTLRGGLLVPSSLEYESVGDFEKQLLYDSAEVSTKPKKRKKAKHLNAAYEHRWQVDSGNQNGQRDYLKKTSESYQFESNGNSGSLGQPIIKKPKIMRPSQDNSFDNIPPSGGSVPSPVASQMSNMSNPNKIIKMLGGRDRGRKAKALKMPPGQLGSGNPWSLFEDQALVVLVHDMGPNWELVSDAINSTMHFKCIFRKAKECKERHNILMDRTSGDGADSAEDSGSSQPYPSTLPGIPKGSARQLFQRLQGPMEEDILKSHFEKIIMIGQKQHYRKPQDLKQRQQPHGSHAIALSQVSPNNLNGGHILTPLDLCDLDTAITDMFSLGYQGPHSSGSGITNQGTVTPMPSASGASSPLQGSTNMMMGSNFSSSGGPLNSFRDGRYMVPRSAPLSTDDQQRLQQLIPGRSIQQANISASGALRGTDRGGRIVPGGGGMGMVGGVNRSLPMARPGSQGFASSSTANSGSVVSPGMPSANMHSGVGAGQGSTMLRPRDGHMMRPDFQIPGNSQGVSHFGGLSSPPVSSYPLHHQPSHPISTQPAQALSPRHPHFQRQANLAPPIAQQQAYAVRLAKDRQQQHRLLQQQQQQQQQQQFPASSSLMPHVQQSQPQHPISSPVQNSSQVLSHSTAPPMNSMPQHQQKQQAPTQGVGRNAQSGGNVLSNQTGKQRPKPHQFANRQHPLQQRQQLQSQQQAKVAKVVGRGNTTMNQCVPIDSTLLNGVSANPGLVKGESTPHIMPNQGSYAAAQPTRQSSSQTLPQQKMYSAQASLSSKHIQVTSNSDNSSQVHVPLAGNQPVSSSAVAGPNHQQASPHQKIVNQNQPALRRAVQPNRLIISDASTKPQGRNPNADEHPTSSSTEKDKTQTLPEAGSNATNVAPVVSPVNVHQWTASEPLLDSNALDSAQPNSSESLPQAGQGPGQRPSTASLPASRHDVSAQWQQKQNQQVQQPQQQAQLLQAGNDDSFDKSSDNRLE